jgi:hypothetical protein
LRRTRFFGLFAVAAAIALIAALPAGALAAEAGSEAPVEPAPAPESPPPVTTPGSTGWVPQSPSTGSSGGSATTQHGSSLGSGGSSQSASSGGDEPASSSEPSAPVEPETAPPPSPPAVEPQTNEPRVTTPVEPVEPPAAEPKAAPAPKGIAGLGDAALVARPELGTIDPASVVAAAPVAASGDHGDSGSGVLPLPIIILCLLFLIYAGARLVLGPVEPDLFRSRRFRFLRRAFDRT